MRNLFVVPRAAVLAPHRESIQAAVQEAAADPSAQGHLIKTLHVRPIIRKKRPTLQLKFEYCPLGVR